MLVCFLLLSSCSSSQGPAVGNEPVLQKILSNTMSQQIATKVETYVETCMTKEGFTYARMKLTDTARSASSEMNFSLHERQQSGFGISSLLEPRSALRQSSDRAFQKSSERCRAAALKSVQVYFDATNKIGVDYLKRRTGLLKSDYYLAFRRLYLSCMSQAGFPNLIDSDAAFAMALVPYKNGSSIARVRAIEIPISVADFHCVSKYDHLRRSAFAGQEAEFYASHQAEFNTLQRLG